MLGRFPLSAYNGSPASSIPWLSWRIVLITAIVTSTLLVIKYECAAKGHTLSAEVRAKALRQLPDIATQLRTPCPCLDDVLKFIDGVGHYANEGALAFSLPFLGRPPSTKADCQPHTYWSLLLADDQLSALGLKLAMLPEVFPGSEVNSSRRNLGPAFIPSLCGKDFSGCSVGFGRPRSSLF